MERGCPQNFIDNTLSEVKFHQRTQPSSNETKKKKRVVPFITQCHPAVPNLKEILMKCYLITATSYRKAHSLKDLKDILVRAKI